MRFETPIPTIASALSAAGTDSQTSSSGCLTLPAQIEHALGRGARKRDPGENEGPFALSPCSRWEPRGHRWRAKMEESNAPRDNDGPAALKRTGNPGKGWARLGATRRGPGRAQ